MCSHCEILCTAHEILHTSHVILWLDGSHVGSPTHSCKLGLQDSARSQAESVLVRPGSMFMICDVKCLTLKRLDEVISQHLSSGTVLNLKLTGLYFVCEEITNVHVVCLAAAGLLNFFLTKWHSDCHGRQLYNYMVTQ